jgi:hypothetical protein
LARRRAALKTKDSRERKTQKLKNLKTQKLKKKERDSIVEKLKTLLKTVLLEEAAIK